MERDIPRPTQVVGEEQQPASAAGAPTQVVRVPGQISGGEPTTVIYSAVSWDQSAKFPTIITREVVIPQGSQPPESIVIE